MAAEVNWYNIDKARRFYLENGFEYLEVPWIVDQEVVSITKPFKSRRVRAEGYNLVGDDLIGSGEQGFLSLVKGKKLTSSKPFMTITPRFRDEDSYDGFHLSYFVKLELFRLGKDRFLYGFPDMSLKMLTSIPGLESSKCIPIETQKMMESECMEIESYDIACRGIELGSYGTRYHKDIGYWTYGTGIAEPRTSQVARIQK